MYPGWTVARDRSFTINGASLAAVSALSNVRRIIMVTAMMSSLVEVMGSVSREVCLNISHFFFENDNLIFSDPAHFP
jgi:hypothetical protein